MPSATVFRSAGVVEPCEVNLAWEPKSQQTANHIQYKPAIPGIGPPHSRAGFALLGDCQQSVLRVTIWPVGCVSLWLRSLRPSAAGRPNLVLARRREPTLQVFRCRSWTTIRKSLLGCRVAGGENPVHPRRHRRQRRRGRRMLRLRCRRLPSVWGFKISRRPGRL